MQTSSITSQQKKRKWFSDLFYYTHKKEIWFQAKRVEASANSPSVGDDFGHLIAYSMACTSENDVGCAMGHEELRFGLLHEVIKGEDLECLGQGKKVLKEGLGSYLERGKVDEEGFLE